MQINVTMNRLIRRLGLAVLDLEKYYPLIKETLMSDTLPIFGQFFPYTYIMKVDLHNTHYEIGVDNAYIYYLKDKFLEENDLEIISVMAVEGSSFFQELNAPPATYNVDGMILEGFAAGIRSQLNISTKYSEFLPPNRLKLRGYRGYGEVKIQVKIPYPNFGFIPESLSIAFEELAELDIKSYLYQELKLYEGLESAEGSINLKLDGWESAASERRDLLDSWRNKAFPNTASHTIRKYE